ncbi:hypothetical protein EHS25_006887 [Saitozyma podzolica]|uniref:RRM domain-containing protein n=1 Tax=Saitozyma podzolica TaxID=1890683 RepID=A0A427XR71_9TREE|nr:hypothetical protein EHS25_006887 [Saitozyma podzolica]
MVRTSTSKPYATAVTDSSSRGRCPENDTTEETGEEGESGEGEAHSHAPTRVRRVVVVLPGHCARILALRASLTPSQRPEPHRKGNPDSPGAWKHDLHESVRQSLASRLAHSHGGSSSPGSRSLLSRLTDKRGQELLPEGGRGRGRGGGGDDRAAASSKLHGFGVTEPVNRNSNTNAGLELLPSTSGSRTHGLGPGAGTGGSDVRSRIGDSRVVASGLSAAGLSGQSQQRTRQVRPLAGGEAFDSAHGHGAGVGSGAGTGVSIAGKARGSIWVRVENLAPETTPDDVVPRLTPHPPLSHAIQSQTRTAQSQSLCDTVPNPPQHSPTQTLIPLTSQSAFAPSPILSALLSPSQTQSQARAGLVSIDLEFASRQPAEEIISQYHGVVADGNTLRVTMVRQSLGERMGSGLGGSGSGSGAGSGFGSRIGAGTSRSNGHDRGTVAPRRSPGGPVELIDAPSSGKLYSDSILTSGPGSSIITLAEESDYSRSRADSWTRGAGASAPSASGGGGLAGRFDRASKPRGRGQIGGGSFADMMVD